MPVAHARVGDLRAELLRKMERACVEEQPAVRKARGVYYTPAQVVDYIIANTVRRILDGKRPPLAARSLCILDPACGAGVFLLAAYRCLLNWHRGRRPLTFQEKKRILLGHIYGVDLDPQAVEATRLTLLLELLAGVRGPTIGSLPDLGTNIKCGNALIGPDFYDGRPMTAFSKEQRRRINVFDWRAEFPQVFGAPHPGFDVVLGNPPYLSYSGRQAVDISPAERAYFARHYRAAGRPTAHGLFMESGATRLSRRFLAFIVPDQVGHLAGYGAVRQIVLERHGLREVRYWGERVFAGAVTPALTFIADTRHTGPVTIYDSSGRYSLATCRANEPWVAGRAAALLAKVRQNTVSLGDLVADPGVHTGNCAAKLIVPLTSGPHPGVPILEGKQVGRYRCDPPRKALRLDYQPQPGEYFTIRAKARYTSAPFVIRQTAGFPMVGPRAHADYFRNSLLALYTPQDGTDVRYLVGVLNSRLLRYVYTQTVRESQQRAFPQVKVRALRALPIRRLDFSSTAETALHTKVVALVQQMLERPTDAADRRIDQLVYRLYGLTKEEIAIVEEATANGLAQCPVMFSCRSANGHCVS